MPRIVWKEFLKGTTRLKPEAKRSMMFEIRRRAQQCMKDLTFIVENMENVTDKPAKQFAKIFTDEIYLPMHDKIMNARRAGVLYKQDMVTPEQIPAFIFALHSAGIAYEPDKLYKRAYRIEVAERLREKEFKTGKRYYHTAFSHISRVQTGYFKHTAPEERELG